MHRALEREDLLVPGFDPDMAQHRLVGALLLAPAQHHAHAVLLENGHGAELHAVAAVERAGRGEIAIADRFHGERALVRRVAGAAGPAADRERDLRADTGAMRGLRGFRIA